MKYISVKEAAHKWNIDTSRVSRLAREGRIDGAIIVARNWLIPKNAEKPSDNRTKNSKNKLKNEARESFFRFPLYVNLDENGFTPKLSDEEKLLRTAQLNFLSCDFKEAEEKLKSLSMNCENVYVRLMALFLLCRLSASVSKGQKYNNYFLNFEIALSEDFPHKKEMELLRPWLYTSLVQYKKASDSYNFDNKYDYSPSVYPLLVYLSFLDKQCFDNYNAVIKRIDLYKIEAKQFENNGNYLEALLLHEEIFIFYFMDGNEEMTYHLKKAIDLAFKYDFIYPLADMYPYYSSVINNVLMDYSHEFTDKIKEQGKKMAMSFSEFGKKHKDSSIFATLSDSEIKYILFSSRGYSHKQVANALHISERTVANRYALLYDKLGVNNKSDFIEIIKKSLS